MELGMARSRSARFRRRYVRADALAPPRQTGQSARVSDSPRPPFTRHSDGSIREGRNAQAEPNLLDRLGNAELTFVRVDHQMRLQFGAFEIVIESPFRLTAVDGTKYDLDPGLRADLGPVLDLYPGALVAATVDDEAALCLGFANGATLHVPADHDYEA